jgi:hypothetical protein
MSEPWRAGPERPAAQPRPSGAEREQQERMK